MLKLMKDRPIIIICGDPESTFNEILIKTLDDKTLKNTKFPIVIIGSKKLLEYELKKTKKNISFLKLDEQLGLNRNKIYIIDIPLDFKKMTLIKKNLYIKKSFDVGLKFVDKVNSLALINGPISKKTFLKGKYSGITEYIAFKTGSVNEVMLIFNNQLSVSPITTHIPINKVEKKIKKKMIISKMIRINDFYKKFLGFKPKIAVTGLNPHCETFAGKNIEKSEILPAIKYLKERKINISGPFSADTIFLRDNRKKFNVIVGMYHDQVLAPMKTIFGFDAINITIGLPFVRITPDHGPNYEMYGLNKSKPDSLIQAFSFLKRYVSKT